MIGIQSVSSTLEALRAIYGRHNRRMNGSVNKQNLSHWLDSDPHLIHESSLRTPIVWYGLGEYVVPTGRCHKQLIECLNQFIGNQVWSTCYLTINLSVVRFNAVRFFSVGLRQGYALCQHASDDWGTSNDYRLGNCSSIGRFIPAEPSKIGFSFWAFCKRAPGSQAKEIEFHT